MAPVLLMIVGCSGGSQSDEPVTAAGKISDALEVVVQGRALLNFPLEGSQETVAQQYEDAGTALDREIERLTKLDVPLALQASRLRALQVMREEREAWTHLVLGVRTGNPVHEIFADQFLAAVDERWTELVAALAAVAEEAGDGSVVQSLTLPVRDAVRLARAPIPTSSPRPTSTPAAAAPQPAITVATKRATLTKIEPSLTPTPEPRPSPTDTPTRTPTRTATATQSPTPTVTQALAASPTPLPSPTATLSPPTPAPTLQPTPSPSPIPPAPTPTQSPIPTVTTPSKTPIAESGQGAATFEWVEDAPVIEFPDWKGLPAYIIHWTVYARPNALTVVKYPFVAGDTLQIDITVEIEGRLSELSGFALFASDTTILETGLINGLYLVRDITATGGEHLFSFDNSKDSRGKTVHLLVTYHEIAPGAKAPPAI